MIRVIDGDFLASAIVAPPARSVAAARPAKPPPVVHASVLSGPRVLLLDALAVAFNAGTCGPDKSALELRSTFADGIAESAAKLKTRGLKAGSAAVDVLQARRITLATAVVTAAACDLSILFLHERAAVGGEWAWAECWGNPLVVYQHVGRGQYTRADLSPSSVRETHIRVVDASRPLKGISSYTAAEVKRLHEQAGREGPPVTKKLAYEAVKAYLAGVLPGKGRYKGN